MPGREMERKESGCAACIMSSKAQTSAEGVSFELVPLYCRLQQNVTLFLSLLSRLENKGMGGGVSRILRKKKKKFSLKKNLIGFEIFTLEIKSIALSAAGVYSLVKVAFHWNDSTWGYSIEAKQRQTKKENKVGIKPKNTLIFTLYLHLKQLVSVCIPWFHSSWWDCVCFSYKIWVVWVSWDKTTRPKTLSDSFWKEVIVHNNNAIFFW